MKLPSLKTRGKCCQTSETPSNGLEKIVLVGNPNVGKSVLFNHFSNSYTIVSNYPGTTVEISKGDGKVAGKEYEIIDTPGMYSMLPITEEERVSQKYVFDEDAHVYIHVVDAKNLRRMLPLTIQLIEADVPLILVLNMMDEAEERGVEIDTQRLAKRLGIPVVSTVSTAGRGLKELEETIANYKPTLNYFVPNYGEEIESAIEKTASALKSEYSISKRTLAQLLLQKDLVAFEKIKQKEEEPARISKIVSDIETEYSEPLNLKIAVNKQDNVNEIVDSVMTQQEDRKKPAGEKQSKKENSLSKQIDKLLIRPITGIPILFLILYFGLYKFVGVFAAGTVVDYLEGTLFGEQINPWVIANFNAFVPYPVIQDLFVGEYGILTQAITYAIALIMPLWEISSSYSR
ncbi:FeoB small GTPase domain-containing protein [Methanohalophilus sp. RSK]|uniref:FeoB small GTPase domain-containing protein n=1 Tax=Methanohalophilus sp. RSK TaxID=2485783 RepID=UPI001F1F60A7|nr:FeoB small GTPase domain-containing protein [Methanohalophilus sp. RSK]